MYYRKDMFEYDFVQRTKRNLEVIEEHVKSLKEQKIPSIEIRAYEVTQLINSFLGLLVLIRDDKYFEFLPDDASFNIGSHASEILSSIKSHKKEYRYHNSYYEYRNHNYIEKTEELTAKSIILRLRNSLAHGRFSFVPQDPGDTGEIEGFSFADEYIIRGFFEDGFFVKWNNNLSTENKSKSKRHTMKWTVTLNIDEIRHLFIEICGILDNPMEL